MTDSLKGRESVRSRRWVKGGKEKRGTNADFEKVAGVAFVFWEKE